MLGEEFPMTRARLMALLVLASIPLLLFARGRAGSGDGAGKWTDRYNGAGNGDDIVRAMAADGRGNVYVTGWIKGAGTGTDFATIKYDADGRRLWVRNYNGPADSSDQALAIAVDASGSAYVAGLSWTASGHSDFAVVKYGSNGKLLWTAGYDGPGGGLDKATAVAVDRAGGVLVAGWSYKEGAYGDYITVKYDDAGRRLWVRKIKEPSASNDGLAVLALDGSGNAFVTVRTLGLDASDDCLTVKYGPNGKTLWTRTYDGPGGGNDAAFALAVDGFANVHLAGWSVGADGEWDYITIKYDKDGRPLWVRRYDGPEKSNDGAFALALDGAGNVYVTGHSQGTDTSSDYATIKYSPAGKRLWTARYNGPANGYDGAAAVGIDRAGNVYVAGSSWVSESNIADYVVLKYAPDGTLRWTKRYDGPGRGLDQVEAMIVESAGRVFVTGSSSGVGTLTDFATVRFQ